MQGPGYIRQQAICDKMIMDISDKGNRNRSCSSACRGTCKLTENNEKDCHTPLDFIRLSLIPGLGPVNQNRLLRICGSIDACFEITEEELRRRDDTSDSGQRIGTAKRRTFIANRECPDIKNRAEMIWKNCKEKCVTVITKDDERYPIRLKPLSDAPIILYTMGVLRINDFACAAGIVGARRCSGEGKQCAITTAIDEVRRGTCIVSGMAKGIDSYAHTAAIKNGGYTIAVLGNGPDICYPKEHIRLYEEIIRSGTVISEYPPGTEAQRYMFSNRNRLIAGLSDKLCVIDAGRNSGTRTTVEAACRYGRKVNLLCCVSGE